MTAKGRDAFTDAKRGVKMIAPESRATLPLPTKQGLPTIRESDTGLI
jgi:hypothetical protein